VRDEALHFCSEIFAMANDQARYSAQPGAVLIDVKPG
jgi:hypothetical protein